MIKTPRMARVAMLAPFEGRYRDVGYEALYAARLAFADFPQTTLEFLPIDDGGTVERAAERARAFTLDATVVGAIVLGYEATAPETLTAFGNVPVMVVGNWNEQTDSSTVYWLTNPEIAEYVTAPLRISITDAARLDAPVIGGEVFALPGFAELRSSLEGITVVSSGSLPDAAFTEHYRSSDPFAPPPGLLASLTYDAVSLLLHAGANSRASLNDAIQTITYEGLNGAIYFEGGVWQEAPIHHYRYENGTLTAADDVVE